MLMMLLTFLYVAQDLKMKDKLIAQLSEEIDKQAWKFKQDN